MKKAIHCIALVTMLALSAGLCVAQDAEQTLAQQAAAATAESDWLQAYRLYTQLTGSEEATAAAWYQLGLVTLNAGKDSSEAVNAFTKARELGFPPGPVSFGIARAHAVSGDHSAVLATLSELADRGPARGVLQRLQSDSAFDSLRSSEQFANLLQRLTPCASAEYRQFDFWIGSWNVVSPAEQAVGTNTVSATLDGCMLTESWESTGGSKGFSINYYDSTTGIWTQTYRDNTGNVSQWPDLSGGLSDGAMVLQNLDNPQNQTRWTWTKITADKVRQMAESSTDGGENWQVVWDSYYLRAE